MAEAATADAAADDVTSVVMRFLDAMAAQDIDAYAAELAEEFTQEIPFVPQGYPQKVGPRDAAVAFELEFWAGVIGNRPGAGEAIGSITDRVVHRTADAGVLIVEYASAFFVGGTETYKNRYISIFTVRSGKLVHWREYANPLAVAATLGYELTPPASPEA
ncbi:limonene-1,2-epoxide hydrolase family protein [Streptomyces antimycoticus]|uniref:nuclear transport factor 2 family protein n=1 Tax=Streptomyces TaxID=1883 RepID=UPI003432E9B2